MTNTKTLEQKTQVASDATQATARAQELLKTQDAKKATTTKREVAQVASLKIDLKNQKYDKNSAVYKKRASYLNRDYQKTVSETESEIVKDTTTDMFTDVCEAFLLDYLCKQYISTNRNDFVSSSQQIKASNNRGAAFGDCNRRAQVNLAKLKCIVRLTKNEMLEQNHVVDASKYYVRLNLNNAYVKTRIAQLREQLAVKATA